MAVDSLKTSNVYSVMLRTSLAARLGLGQAPAEAPRLAREVPPPAGEAAVQETSQPRVNGQGQLTGRIVDTQA